MTNDGKAGSIFQSMQEIGSFVSRRIQQKAAESPLITNLAHGAAARIKQGVEERVKAAKPANVIGTPRDTPEEARGDTARPAASFDGTLGGALTESLSTTVADALRSFLTALPQVARLLWRLTADPRVPLRHKVILGGAAAYLISPFDILPDTVPGIGRLDDFAVIVAALDIVLNQTADDIVRSHWTGDPHMLDGIRKAIGIASQLRGGKVRRWLLRGGDV